MANYDLSHLGATAVKPTAVKAKSTDYDLSHLGATPAPTPLAKTADENPVKFTGASKGTIFALPNPDDAEEMDAYHKQVHDRVMGGVQSIANTPIEIANLFKKEKFKPFDFAAHNRDAEIGKTAGDIGSFFIPGMGISKTLKAATYLPKVGKNVNSLLNTVKDSVALNGLAQIGKTTLDAGIYNARKNPDHPLSQGLIGGGEGGAAQTAANLMTSKNPLVGFLARTGTGYAMGHLVGHPVYGAMAGSALPQLASVLGLTGRSSIEANVLDGLEGKDVGPAKAANDRLGTVITPAQASGNYATAATEGRYKRSPQGSQYAYRQEQAQTRGQSSAINRMLDSIYKSTPAKEKEINDLYTKSDAFHLPDHMISDFKQNAIVRSAFKTVKSDPAFSDVPETSYKFLSEVSRQLNRDYESAAVNKTNSAYQINQTKKWFSNRLKNENADYAAATAAARPKMVRENIESKFNKNEEDYSGKNFYNKFLNTRKSTRDLLNDVKDFPEAQQAIKDMRAGWKHLSNIKTVSQGEAQAKTGLDQARDLWLGTMEALKKFAGARNDVKGLKFIYSKDWDNGFDKIMKMKEAAARNRALMGLIGKVAVANHLTDEPNPKNDRTMKKLELNSYKGTQQ